MKLNAKLAPYIRELQTQLRIGAVRAAFRRVDEVMRYEISISAAKADEEWEGLKCKGSKELPKFLVDLVYLIGVLEAAERPKPSTSIYNKL